MNHPGWVEYQRLVNQNIEALNQIDLSKEDGYLARFAVFSANLTNFLPHIPVSTHPELFRQNLIHVALETFDRTVPHLSDMTRFEGEAHLVSVQKLPFIFCTFHLGSYRSMASWLVRLGYDFSVLVRQAVFEQQSVEIIEHAHQIKAVYPSTSDVHVINAEEPSSVLKILRELRAGRSLVVYMDGNAGSGHEKGPTIDFFERQLYAKQGGAFLSYASGVPILPVVCFREEDHQNVITVAPPIYPDKTQTKEHYSQQITQQLYGWFSGYLAQYPAQWEAWNYIHHSLHLPDETPVTLPETAFQKNIYHFNHQRFSLFQLQEEAILFDRLYYQTYEITADLYEYLQQTDFLTPQNVLGEALFSDLVAQFVLV